MKKPIQVLCILFFLIVLSACGPSTITEPESTPQPPQAIIETFSGISSYSGGSGKYVVDCAVCSASVTNSQSCQQKQDANGIDGTQIYTIIQPGITVIHNSEVFSDNVVTSDNAEGSWVISEESIPYVREFERPENLICTAHAVFTVVMNDGGTVTKLP